MTDGDGIMKKQQLVEFSMFLNKTQKNTVPDPIEQLINIDYRHRIGCLNDVAYKDEINRITGSGEPMN